MRVKNSDQIFHDDKPVALDQLAATIQSTSVRNRAELDPSIRHLARPLA